MIIWSYLIPTKGRAYGTPVRVHIPGKGDTQVAYQFGTPEQPCAVVHLQSGQVIAPIYDKHTGYPEQRARQACAEKFAGLSTHEHIARRIDELPVLNAIPRVEA